MTLHPEPLFVYGLIKRQRSRLMITILRQKIIFFQILGGARAGCAPPPWIRPCINDLSEYMKSSQLRLFADDSIIYKTIKSQKDCDSLQEDLDAGNTPTIFAPPSARRNFFKCAPPNLKSCIRPWLIYTRKRTGPRTVPWGTPGCWLILSVYIIMSLDFPFVRLFGVR
jgi:hypothetical protein